MFERRAFSRIRVDVPASLFLYQVELFQNGAIVDLSLGGCFFPTTAELAVKDPCTVTLTTGIGLETKSVELQGEIARKTPQGVGIRFIDVTAKARGILEEIISREMNPA